MIRTGNEVVRQAASASLFMRVVVNGEGSSSVLRRSSFVLRTHLRITMNDATEGRGGRGGNVTTQ